MLKKYEKITIESSIVCYIHQDRNLNEFFIDIKRKID